MVASRHIAVDLGAESGRVIVGTVTAKRITVQEVHRFVNPQRRILGHLHWDLLYLFEEIKNGVRAAVHEGFTDVSSLGVDAWGVDFGLVGAQNEILGLPVAYRDVRTDGMMEEVFRKIPREELFAATGIQPMQINSLFQLYAAARSNARIFDSCRALLFIPDLMNLLLTGRCGSERTIASTSQMLDAKSGTWATAVMDRVGLPSRILPPLAEPGEVFGEILPEVADEMGLDRRTVVVAVGSHDTASAVAAVPVSGGDWAFLSSGTWSLVGQETDAAVISPNVDARGFTNEAGVGGKTLLLKNVMGMWLLQECRREWDKQGHRWTYEDLTRIAMSAPPLRSIINPDDPSFLHPESMTEAIRRFCRAAHQPVPETEAAIVRCIFESLALTYRHALHDIVQITGNAIALLHIVGGGSQNPLLNQWTADATGIPVLAGPMEATAYGNIIAQAIAQGTLRSWEEGRRLVTESCHPVWFEPGGQEQWVAAGAASVFT